MNERVGSSRYVDMCNHWSQLLARFDSAEARCAIIEHELHEPAQAERGHREWWLQASPMHRLIYLELQLIGEPVGLADWNAADVARCVASLEPAERFWWDVGGLMGYQVLLMQQLCNHTSESQLSLEHPPTISLQPPTESIWSAMHLALQRLSEVALILPVGGAGDRLGLQDPVSGEALPVALLHFDGRSLLQGIIEDLEALEWLCYRVTGKQVTVPIVMMTSAEKHNHSRIRDLCERQHWFKRPRESFRLIQQPRVPAIDDRGSWVFTGPGEILLKPGGHGAIWRLLDERGIFQWLADLHVRYGLIRQINNPLAGSDNLLLSLLGLGISNKKLMGLASCPRLVGASEGMNVLCRRPLPDGTDTTLTNIEYTAFKHHGLRDEPEAPGSLYSCYPCNTNIIFADLQGLKERFGSFPMPGLTLNLKEGAVGSGASAKRLVMGRLEGTMQNLADFLSIRQPRDSLEQLPTFCTYTPRNLCISVTKRQCGASGDLLETPQGADRDLQRQRYQLLLDAGWQLPAWDDVAPLPCRLRWHPALGPLHTLIKQRLGSGSITHGSWLQLELAECGMHKLALDGVLQIYAACPFGGSAHGQHHYAATAAQVELIDCSITNEPLQQQQLHDLSYVPQQGCVIELQGRSRFTAKGVHLNGAQHIVVADGEWLDLSSVNGEIKYRRLPWSANAFSADIDWNDALGPQLHHKLEL